MQGLFEEGENYMSYPDTPGFVKHSETSRYAADNLTTAEKVADDIVSWLEFYPDGRTADELRDDLAVRHKDIQSGTVAARLRGLDLVHRVCKTTTKRKTRNNRPAHVYKLPKYSMPSEVIQPMPEGRDGGAHYRKALEDIQDHLLRTGFGKEHQPIMDILNDVLK